MYVILQTLRSILKQFQIGKESFQKTILNQIKYSSKEDFLPLWRKSGVYARGREKASGLENKMEKVFPGSLSKSRITCMGVGGGAYSNTLQGRMVLRNGVKPHALFIKSKGDLACSVDQAIVPVQIGDVILEFVGSLPAILGNPDLKARGYRVISIALAKENGNLCIIAEEMPILPEGWESQVPWEALGTYHNRDGNPFVA